MLPTLPKHHQTLNFRPDAQEGLAPQFTPIVMDPLEQELVMRYLRAKCHPVNRLQAQSITFPPNVAIPPTPKALDAMGSNQNRRNRPKEQTPTHKGGIALKDFQATPTPPLDAEAHKRKAVSLDCEMVTLHSGTNEVAFLSAVDVLTGEVLINAYVMPSQRVRNWNTRSSGITPALMNRAGKNGKAIMGGWKAARQLLWTFVDADTVLIGHAIQNDLNVLGMYHYKIVDSAILTAEAVFISFHSTRTLSRTWSLKTIAKELLGYEIQNRRTGHIALEDTFAARDVVIWCIQHPEEFKSWAEDAREIEEEKERERAEARAAIEKENQRIAAELEAGKSAAEWSTDSNVANEWGEGNGGTTWENPDMDWKATENPNMDSNGAETNGWH